MAQIIDEDAHVVNNLSEYLDSIGITTSGVDYHIISIIGAQSSGKSTLLNNIFNTSFQTMVESTGRQQTTKGIHAAYSEEHKILIFDIEGSDSRERGDSDSLFERKAALFALALSEVVMVNMWVHDIGRYNGSSTPLLKTVFEVNLQLFSSESKCHLLFVVRDIFNIADTEVIEGQVKKDLEEIWKSLTLPPHLAGRPFEDFFIFHFFALPHYKIKRPEFDQEVVKLRDEFEDPSNEKFLFKQPTGKIIPGDGLYNYICNVWDAISHNKELNLPSQRRTLSNFRCDEFAKKCLEEFEESVKTQIEPNLEDDRIIPDFACVCNSIIDKTLSEYDDESKQYVTDIVEEKRKSLLSKISEILHRHYQTNCSHFYKKCENDFVTFINDQLPSDLKESEDWERKAIDELNSIAVSLHSQITKDVVRGFEWEFDASNFEISLQDIMNKKMDSLIVSLEDSILTEELKTYKDSIDEVLKDAPNNMWELLREQMNSSIKRCRDEVTEILTKNTVIQRSCSNRIDEKFHRATIGRILIASRYVPQKMNMKFDEKFRQDENGKTRDWKPDDDIPLIFEEARQSGINVLKMFSQCQLRKPGEPIPPNDILTQQMINPITAQGLEDKFNDAIEKVYIDAVRIRESKKIRINIPWWMWTLYIYFGWSKIVFFFKHPILIFVLAAFAVIMYFMYKKGYLAIIYNRAKDLSMQGMSVVLNFIDQKTRKKENKNKKRRKRSKTVPNSNSKLDQNSNQSQEVFQQRNTDSTNIKKVKDAHRSVTLHKMNNKDITGESKDDAFSNQAANLTQSMNLLSKRSKIKLMLPNSNQNVKKNAAAELPPAPPSKTTKRIPKKRQHNAYQTLRPTSFSQDLDD